jgi:phosphoglycerate dehydrogenase-like enzyme
MALVRALKEGWIAGAGLDVFPIEPPDHPIFDCPNMVMTAHMSLEPRPAGETNRAVRGKRTALYRRDAAVERGG